MFCVHASYFGCDTLIPRCCLFCEFITSGTFDNSTTVCTPDEATQLQPDQKRNEFVR